MASVIVRYRVKADKGEENIAYINAVFRALKKAAPEGLRHASFVAEDGVSFTHIASIETEDGGNPLSQLPGFQAFFADIGSRCDQPPQPTPCSIIGC